jgi:hypothetical protein
MLVIMTNFTIRLRHVQYLKYSLLTVNEFRLSNYDSTIIINYSLGAYSNCAQTVFFWK